jgi:uncharacterized membrane protein YdjX (TVP38/TMEM64 family)
MPDAPSPVLRRSRIGWRIVSTSLSVLALGILGYLMWRNWDHEALLAWKRGAGPLRYFTAMALLPALGVPLSPFFMIAGATFGAGVGLLGSGLALAAHLTLCYLLSKSALRPRLTALLRRFEHLPDFTDESAGALRFTLLVKLAPGVPSAAKNYVLGLAGVPFAVYFVVSMAMSGSLGVGLVLLGESLFDHDLVRLALVGMLLAVLLAAALWWRRRRARASASSQ